MAQNRNGGKKDELKRRSSPHENAQDRERETSSPPGLHGRNANQTNRREASGLHGGQAGRERAAIDRTATGISEHRSVTSRGTRAYSQDRGERKDKATDTIRRQITKRATSSSGEKETEPIRVPPEPEMPIPGITTETTPQQQQAATPKNQTSRSFFDPEKQKQKLHARKEKADGVSPDPKARRGIKSHRVYKLRDEREARAEATALRGSIAKKSSRRTPRETQAGENVINEQTRSKVRERTQKRHSEIRKQKAMTPAQKRARERKEERAKESAPSQEIWLHDDVSARTAAQHAETKTVSGKSVARMSHAGASARQVLSEGEADNRQGRSARQALRSPETKSADNNDKSPTLSQLGKRSRKNLSSHAEGKTARQVLHDQEKADTNTKAAASGGFLVGAKNSLRTIQKGKRLVDDARQAARELSMDEADEDIGERIAKTPRKFLRGANQLSQLPARLYEAKRLRALDTVRKWERKDLRARRKLSKTLSRQGRGVKKWRRQTLRPIEVKGGALRLASMRKPRTLRPASVRNVGALLGGEKAARLVARAHKTRTRRANAAAKNILTEPAKITGLKPPAKGVKGALQKAGGSVKDNLLAERRPSAADNAENQALDELGNKIKTAAKDTEIAAKAVARQARIQSEKAAASAATAGGKATKAAKGAKQAGKAATHRATARTVSPPRSLMSKSAKDRFAARQTVRRQAERRAGAKAAQTAASQGAAKAVAMNAAKGAGHVIKPTIMASNPLGWFVGIAALCVALIALACVVIAGLGESAIGGHGMGGAATIYADDVNEMHDDVREYHRDNDIAAVVASAQTLAQMDHVIVHFYVNGEEVALDLGAVYSAMIDNFDDACTMFIKKHNKELPLNRDAYDEVLSWYTLLNPVTQTQETWVEPTSGEVYQIYNFELEDIRVPDPRLTQYGFTQDDLEEMNTWINPPHEEAYWWRRILGRDTTYWDRASYNYNGMFTGDMSAAAARVFQECQKYHGWTFVKASNNTSHLRGNEGFADCSSFVHRVFEGAFGLDFGCSGYYSTTRQQYMWCLQQGVAWPITTQPNWEADLIPGDLIFWCGSGGTNPTANIHHVAIYLGDGKAWQGMTPIIDIYNCTWKANEILYYARPLSLVTYDGPGLPANENGAVLTAGASVTIPSSMPQAGIAGHATNFNSQTWAYEMGKVQRRYYSSGSQTVGHLCAINNYFLVAVSPPYGNAGDVLLVELEDGTKFNAIVADHKNPNDSHYTKYGHLANGKLNVIEWEATTTDTQVLKNDLLRLGYYGKDVRTVTNMGPYWVGGP